MYSRSLSLVSLSLSPFSLSLVSLSLSPFPTFCDQSDQESGGAIPVSLRDKIGVWKNIRTILMGLGAFWTEKLDHPDGVLSP